MAQFIPNVGTYISIALPALVGFTSGDPVLGVWVLLWGIAYQQVENLTFEPRISGPAVDVHPAVSFASALLGAQLFGLPGRSSACPSPPRSWRCSRSTSSATSSPPRRSSGSPARGPQRRAGPDTPADRPSP